MSPLEWPITDVFSFSITILGKRCDVKEKKKGEKGEKKGQIKTNTLGEETNISPPPHN